MNNMEYLRSKVKFHIRDVKSNDTDIDNVILDVINEIAINTKIFKKIYGFSIHKDIELYDFNALLQMNEETETELVSVTIGEHTREELLTYLTEYEVFPSPLVTKVTENDTIKSKFINVISMTGDDGRNISDYFQYFGSSQYKLYDEMFREENDGMHCIFTAQIIPDVEELLPEDLEVIAPAIITGCKFYFNDSMMSADDAQVANLFYRRYYAKIQELINLKPTHAVGFNSVRKELKWL